MLLGKKRKLGRQIREIKIGETLSLTEKIEDKDLLLYLGLTNDANPLYIQHDYASLTPCKKPIVPSVMLTGVISSAVSKYLPGPGSHIVKQELTFLTPVYHYSVIQYFLKVTEVYLDKNRIEIEVHGKNEDEKLVLEGRLEVCPPPTLAKLDGHALDNF
ncbi:enoyl-CoA hydratase [Bacillus lacus]|uniref:Enoyl-CoA hydratase n=1 Tax=Metabacillus lacus TaxID=1983721 RepID=A0A7X2IYE5_9BACI|nr:MaoC/PaaZ C-terminal domain-containing protein [Metabacillus lacus]MRX71757.1 enoyl-CoA hydratase [Metabacillus lacus]